jgi:hypothetical protein
MSDTFGIGGIAQAAGSIATSMIQANAARDVAKTAANQQKWAIKESAKLSAPYRGLGEAAIPAYQRLLGIGAGGQQDPAQMNAQLAQMPGYQFQQQQGNDATKRQASAMGLGLSGNTLKALSDYNQGLASTSYQQQLQNLLQPIDVGQASAAGQASAVQAGANNMGTIATNAGNALGNIGANAISGVSTALNQGMQNQQTLKTLQRLQQPSSFGSYQGGFIGGPAQPQMTI